MAYKLNGEWYDEEDLPECAVFLDHSGLVEESEARVGLETIGTCWGSCFGILSKGLGHFQVSDFYPLDLAHSAQ